jgi:hypothetical protein
VTEKEREKERERRERQERESARARARERESARARERVRESRTSSLGTSLHAVESEAKTFSLHKSSQVSTGNTLDDRNPLHLYGNQSGCIKKSASKNKKECLT